jgi:hypothetical protein
MGRNVCARREQTKLILYNFELHTTRCLFHCTFGNGDKQTASVYLGLIYTKFSLLFPFLLQIILERNAYNDLFNGEVRSSDQADIW